MDKKSLQSLHLERNRNVSVRSKLFFFFFNKKPSQKKRITWQTTQKKSIKKCQLKRVTFTKSYLSKLKADEVLHLKTISHKHLWKEVGIENKNITKLFTSLIALKNCTYYRKVVVRCNVEHSWWQYDNMLYLQSFEAHCNSPYSWKPQFLLATFKTESHQTIATQ